MPVTKKTGEEVFAGTIIKSGSITVKAEKVGDERTVSRIIKLVEDANSNKADIQNYGARRVSSCRTERRTFCLRESS